MDNRRASMLLGAAVVALVAAGGLFWTRLTPDAPGRVASQSQGQASDPRPAAPPLVQAGERTPASPADEPPSPARARASDDESGIRLHGRVHDAGGDAIPATSVSVSMVAGAGPAWGETVVCDDAGTYEVTLPRARISGLVTVSAIKAEFRPAREQIGAERLHRCVDGVLQLDLCLQRGRAVIGKVMARGRPAAGARVHGCCSTDPRANVLTWCEANGVFAFGLEGELSLDRVIVNHGEYGCLDQLVGEQAPLSDLGVLELSELDVLSGRVTTPDGRGIAALPLRLGLVGDSVRAPTIGETVWTVVTDASGGFHLYGMRDGNYRVLMLGAMVEQLWAEPPVIAKRAQEQVVTLDVVRVRVRIEKAGQTLPESAAEITWTPGAARSSGDEDKRWNSLEVCADRLVPRGSSWHVQARALDGTASGSWDFVADGSDDIRQTIELK